MPLAVIKFIGGSGGGEIDNSLPGGGQIDNTLPGGIQLPPGAAQLPVFPFDPTIDNSLPSGGGNYPSQGLPGSGGRPDQGLPNAPVRPDQSLPGSGNRPSHQPIHPGAKFIVKWMACVGLILVPDNSLPSGSGRPDQSLPSTPEPKK